MGELSEDGEHKLQVTVSEEKKNRQEEVQGEEAEDAHGDGSHTPSSQQLERPEGKASYPS